MYRVCQDQLSTLAALLTAVSVHGAALAQSHGDVNLASGHRSNKVIENLREKIPSDAYGSLNDPAGTLSRRSSENVGYNGQVVGRDPDRNIRLQILRDQ
jgi:hypothetical protein